MQWNPFTETGQILLKHTWILSFCWTVFQVMLILPLMGNHLVFKNTLIGELFKQVPLYMKLHSSMIWIIFYILLLSHQPTYKKNGEAAHQVNWKQCSSVIKDNHFIKKFCVDKITSILVKNIHNWR